MRRSFLFILLFSITSLFSQSTWNTNFVGHFGVYKSCKAIESENEFAYFIDDDLFVIRDITNPELPYETGSITIGPNWVLEFNNEHAYIIGNQQLTAINTNNAYLPYIAGHINTNNANSDLCIKNSYAFVASGYGGLQIYDISNPQNIIEVGVYDSIFFAGSIDVSGHYAYLASIDSIHVIDISIPQSPFKISSYATPHLLLPGRLKVYNGYAYLGFDSNGLLVLDINNPENIFEVGNYLDGVRINNVSFYEDEAYVSSTDTGFIILDIGDPKNIIIKGSINHSCLDATINGDLAYLACNNDGFSVINITIPEEPIEILRNYTPDEIWDVDIKDNYAFLSAGDSGLRVVDISDISKSIEVGHFNTNSRLLNLEIDNEYAYLAAFDTGLYILNISQVESPFEVGFVEIDYAYDIKVRDGYGFLTNSYDHDLIILDINDPGNPVEISRISIPGYTLDIALQDDYALIASDEYGLTIVDISNPASPFETGRFDDGMMSVFGVDVAGDFAYLCSSINGFIIVDISDKYQPAELERMDIYEPHTVKIKNSMAYVTGYFMGMQMIDISVPANPIEVGFYTFGNETYTSNIAFKDEEIFIGAHDYGMLIVHDWLITSTEEIKEHTTAAISVHPNPASNTTAFHFELKEQAEVILYIYNQKGELIETLEKQSLSKGKHEVKLNVTAFPSGSYYYKFVTGKVMHSGKFLVVN